MTEHEDNLGGYHPDPALAKWPCGSIFSNEGQRLYRLVREHKPKIIVELGTMHGCGASHLALGCKHNGFGKVYSIDNRMTIGDQTGAMIPEDLKPFVKLITADALTYRWPGFMKIDLLFEDAAHSTGFNRAVLPRYPASIVAVHDMCHVTAGVTVRPESIDVLGEPTEIFFEPPSDCGLGIWIKGDI